MPAKRLIAAAAFFCILSCSSTQLMPGYRHFDAANSTLGVVLIKKNLAVSNPEDVSECLGGGNPEQAYYDFFGFEFPSVLKKKSTFKHVVFARGADERMDRAISDVSPDVVMSLPPGRRFFSDTIEYLLIIDQLGTCRIRKNGSQIASEGSFITGFGGVADEIIFSAMFILWDNVKGGIAAYGTIREKNIPFIQLSRSVWMEMLERIASDAVAGTPYRK